ncbi:hypothetical protein SLEP1_g26176 [Rubroshorea leprosula]|uniref:Uncharacterized protein n=1 Tax=Rubroshorea leprosula TaxID=152421 RepID=A0AAV5JLB6_9ROSI|nr:hypothetical protein SLEP1_g26176 [Rubroshorea leprosula]
MHLWDPSHECTVSVASRNWVLGHDKFNITGVKSFVLAMANSL